MQGISDRASGWPHAIISKKGSGSEGRTNVTLPSAEKAYDRGQAV